MNNNSEVIKEMNYYMELYDVINECMDLCIERYKIFLEVEQSVYRTIFSLCPKVSEIDKYLKHFDCRYLADKKSICQAINIDDKDELIYMSNDQLLTITQSCFKFAKEIKERIEFLFNQQQHMIEYRSLECIKNDGGLGLFIYMPKEIIQPSVLNKIDDVENLLYALYIPFYDDSSRHTTFLYEFRGKYNTMCKEFPDLIIKRGDEK